jgi:cardiolipin synthase
MVYHPLNPLKGSQPYSPNMRDHRKLLVIDGAIGFTGGVNISSVYSSSPSARLHRRVKSQDADHAPWRDTDIELEGPSVTELERLFQANWSAAGGPALQNPGPVPVTLAPKENKGQETKTPEIDQAVVRIISETPELKTGHEIYSTVLAQMATAQSSIQITMAYFVPDPRLLGVLESAARRGVKVQIVLPSFSDSWAVIAAGRANYQPLLDAGVQIYERRGSLLHAKTAVIDGVWSTVGSSNLDWRSFDLNNEVNAVVLGPQFGAQMQDLFDADLNHSPPITANAWRNRSYFERAREQIALLMQRWL